MPRTHDREPFVSQLPDPVSLAIFGSLRESYSR